jgi:hypothetical protein
MSDTPTAYPPPPPPNVSPAPPTSSVPPPPVYQGPAAPDYVQPYLQQQQQPYGAQPMALGGAMAGGLLYQLGGPAAWSIVFGLASIIVPFAFGYYFIVLPIAGLIGAVRAMQRGRLIGGVIGIVVNLIGGLISLISSGLIGG